MTLLCTGQLRSLLDFILLQIDVDAICKWISLNYLILNILQCCYMIFTRKRHPILPTTPLMVNNLALAKADSFKYLGMNLSANLSWSEHVDCIAVKTRRLVGLLYRRFYGYLDSHIANGEVVYYIHPSTFRIRLQFVVPTSRKTSKLLKTCKKFAFRV